MKTIFLLFTISFFSFNVGAQAQRKITYLTISIRGAWDKKMQRGCYRIFADDGNPYAKDVYDLVWFYSDKTPNKPASFFDDRSDTATVIYNYFNNPTSALMFMSNHGWELITVNNSITSDRGHGGDYTEITSIPIYYFKKLVD